MKLVITLLALTLISFKSYALSDFDRGVLFYSNAYSYGTFVADMEGRMAQIKLEYEKRKAELRNNYETNRRAEQVAQLNEDIHFNSGLIENLRLEKTATEARLKSFATVVSYAQGLFEEILTRELLESEIEELAQEDETFRKDWEHVLTATKEVLSSVPSSNESEMVFSTALEAQAHLEVLLTSIQSEIEELEAENSSLIEKLKVLP